MAPSRRDRRPSISIHAPRGGSDAVDLRGYLPTKSISIHAPRGGSDPVFSVKLQRRIRNFNPRSPRGERQNLRFIVDGGFRFQSTLPAGGATTHRPTAHILCRNFNPRSPRGERPPVANAPFKKSRFQSTLPAGGATPPACAYIRGHTPISIHAPRGGSDYFNGAENGGGRYDFNPRSPRGERPGNQRASKGQQYKFQSTLPAGGATG